MFFSHSDYNSISARLLCSHSSAKGGTATFKIAGEA